MEMQQLRHFLAAVRHGNFAKAADDVNITQSGLSRSIKTLEDVLGLPVLVRNARGVEATKFGAALVPHAKAILNERERALEKLLAIRQQHLGSVRLGVTPQFRPSFRAGRDRTISNHPTECGCLGENGQLSEPGRADQCRGVRRHPSVAGCDADGFHTNGGAAVRVSLCSPRSH